jgi:hypothetical protein
MPFMKTIQAIYENGVFRPIGPVDLPEGSRVTLEPSRVEVLQPQPTDPEFAHLEPGLARIRAILSELPRVDALRRGLQEAEGLIEPTAEDHDRAWEGYKRGEAAQAGSVDHISFLVMRRLGLTQAFTNDAHFRAAGFETLF